jgi:galactose-1-phosphate uridylyltransferase
MINELQDCLKNVQAADLKVLEQIVRATVLDSTGRLNEHEIKIRKNPAFSSRSRIAPERESRPMEISEELKPRLLADCYFCNPDKCAKFSPETGLKEQYFLNDSIAFSNLFPSGGIHGVVVYNYKEHITDPRQLTLSNIIDAITLVKQVGEASKKKYVSSNINCGSKAAASIEHFHGQFHCEDKPIARTMLSLNRGREWWKSWVKAMDHLGLVIDYDADSKTVLYAEWSPAFGKTELVIMNFESPSFMMNDNEIKTVAKFLQKAMKITYEISDQFNVVNLSASKDDDYCNHFRVVPRSPSSQALKSWEGYLELAGETVPHIHPEKLAELAKQIG